MKQLAIILAIVGFTALNSCTSEPKRLVYGKDVCQVCKMTLADKKSGAELITDKELTYKFDDISCLLSFLNSNSQLRMDYSYLLVVDHARDGKLINAADAYYFQSTDVVSPMKGSIAAFNSQQELSQFGSGKVGKTMTWEEVIAELDRQIP